MFHEECTTRWKHDGTLAPRMQRLFRLLPNVAASDAPVLIEGPSGTGKELVARAIVSLSARHHKPFVRVNCGALPDNLLAQDTSERQCSQDPVSQPLLDALAAHAWDRSKTARSLGIARNTLWRRMKEHGLTSTRKRPTGRGKRLA
jgi:DNA-binding NtrC family response regulator